MSRLTADGTAEPVSQDQISVRRKRGQGKTIFPVELTTSRIGNRTRLMHALCAECAGDLYIVCVSVYLCVCVCVFIKLHITTQSGPVILVILCHSH